MICKSLYGLDADEIFDIISPMGFTRVHAVSIALGIYRKRKTDISQITGIPGKLKKKLAGKKSIGNFLPIDFQVSEDQTIKYIFCSDKSKMFETVYIPGEKRNTVCISVQSGCRMGCSFCATGSYGFYGDLSAGEMVNQILSIPDSGCITHIVFMGMGEPMDNLGNVLKACKIITAEWGLAISARNVTVSSAGITPGIIEFLDKSQCNLTVSLHSPFPEERKKVVPLEKLYPVKDIIGIMKNYPVRKKRRLSLAYVMISGVNDSISHLEGLKALLGESKVRINLLPYHPVRGELNRSSSSERMRFFKHSLIVSGISASIRRSRGVDISAACGLLASEMKHV